MPTLTIELPESVFSALQTDPQEFSRQMFKTIIVPEQVYKEIVIDGPLDEARNSHHGDHGGHGLRPAGDGDLYRASEDCLGMGGVSQ